MNAIDQVVVHGKMFELEERVCSRGCGVKFKVQPSSDQMTARRDCSYVCFGDRFTADRITRNRCKALGGGVVPVDRLKKVEVHISKMQVSLWNECVKNVKRFKDSSHLTYMDKMEVALWASAAAKSMPGKGDRLKDFAECTDIEFDQLSKWLRIKKEIADKLDHDIDCEDEDILDAIANRISENMSKGEIEKLLHDEIKNKYREDLKSGLSAAANMRDILGKPGVDFSILPSKDRRKLKPILKDLLAKLDLLDKKDKKVPEKKS